jgi:hypothetical protein
MNCVGLLHTRRPRAARRPFGRRNGGRIASRWRCLDDGVPVIPRALRLILVGTLLTACQATALQPSRPPIVDAPGTPAVAATRAPVATPSPTSRPTPAPTARPTPAPTPPPATAFALNLHGEGDFVPQHTFEWCVGASIQMAWNMVVAETRGSFEDQQALWELARSHSTNSFRGANPRG